MYETLRATLLFILDSVFDLYLFILIIRLVLAYIHADYVYPITQFVAKFTNFIIKPLKNYMPNAYGIETATVFLIFAIELIKFFFISLLSYGVPNILGLAIIAISDAARLLLLTFFYAIMLQAILSFIQRDSSIYRLLTQFTAIILWPIQRLIPPIAGIDISPIPALLFIQVTIMLIVNPFMKTGMNIAFG